MSDLICPRGYICDFINETLVYPLGKKHQQSGKNKVAQEQESTILSRAFFSPRILMIRFQSLIVVEICKRMFKKIMVIS